MSKSRCDNELEKMTAERDHWRKVAQQRTDQLATATIQVSQLRDTLATQRDNAELLGGETGVINALLKQRDEWRRYFEAAESDLKSMIEKYKQLEVILNPNRFQNLEELFAMSDEEIQRAGGTKFNSANPALFVGYIIVARSPEQATPYFKQGMGAYFGSIDSLHNEVQRFQHLVWRAPMPEDVRGSRMDTFGVSQELQLQAIQSLSMYVFDPELRHQYGEQLDQVFKLTLEPHCEPHMREKAPEAFRKSVQATYEKLAQNRGFNFEMPKLTAGARGKSD